MNPEERIRLMSGVSKRLFLALCDFRGEPAQLEDALFQLASVIDSTSKFHFPEERSSKRRFVDYLELVATDIFLIATKGRVRLESCTFLSANGEKLSFGEILYGIRCSSYHDPNEVDDLIHWGSSDTFGAHNGKFVVNTGILYGLFLILLSDSANENLIDLKLFDDRHYLIVGDTNYPFNRFVGNRPFIFECLGIENGSTG